MVHLGIMQLLQQQIISMESPLETDTFVGVGASGNIIRSTDNGSSFDNVTSPRQIFLIGVAFGNNTFVAVSVEYDGVSSFIGNIGRSTDNGSSWENVTSPTSNYFSRVTF